MLEHCTSDTFAYKIYLDRYKTNPPDNKDCYRAEKLNALIHFLAANPAFPLTLKDGQKISFKHPKTGRNYIIENHNIRL